MVEFKRKQIVNSECLPPPHKSIHARFVMILWSLTATNVANEPAGTRRWRTGYLNGVHFQRIQLTTATWSSKPVKLDICFPKHLWHHDSLDVVVGCRQFTTFRVSWSIGSVVVRRSFRFRCLRYVATARMGFTTVLGTTNFAVFKGLRWLMGPCIKMAPIRSAQLRWDDRWQPQWKPDLELGLRIWDGQKSEESDQPPPPSGHGQ